MHTQLMEKIANDFENTVRYHPQDEGNLIGLPYKYTVPNVSGRFQELYYWDTYFANLGLLALGKIELAKSNVNNFLYIVERFGFIPNGSRTFFLNRSQPPFLSRMVKDLYAVLQDKEWLKGAYETLKKEYAFWQEKRLLKNRLNGYCPIDTFEALKGGADYFLGRVKRETLGEENLVPDYPSVEELSEAEQRKLGRANLSFCESGWDYTSRFMDEGHNYAAIDLNSLLFDMEENMRVFCVVLGNGEESVWAQRKQERLIKMQGLWNEEEGLFLDYNVETEKFSPYKSLASVYPTYANLATKEQAERTVKFIESIELPYGFAAGESKLLWHMQWDFPKIWAPLQVILYDGLKNYGYDELAKRVATKYVALVEKQYAETGELWEKYDGLTGNHPSSACPMTGWSAGAYVYFKSKI